MVVIYPECNRLVSFASVHHAIRAEKLLRTAGIRAEAMPTPQEISISCGQCLAFKDGDQEELLALLQKHRVQWSKLFSRDYARREYEELAEFEQSGMGGEP